ncbi:MAG: acyl-CoA thioesterase II [Parasphingopyxis sp.]|uniref:acyl-CoA thioesterase n=1 Tax=Parasphingopyxis sp. TaxID=1920299 RepID=UPI0032EE623F
MSESDPAGDFDPYTASPQQLVDEFVGLLDVEPIDTDLYRGAQLHGGRGRIFGGQVIAQALAAAEKSVGDDRTPHSLHAYFTRAGDENFPVIYRVTRDRDGRSFSTRRVIAQQKGRPILSMAVNFQVPEEGLHHQFDMPDAPPPEDLISELDFWKAHEDRIPEAFRWMMLRPRPIEMRPCEDYRPHDGAKREPVSKLWIKAVAPLPDDPAIHRAALAHASDARLMGTSMLPHGVDWQSGGMQTASLDHALWLHEDFRIDEWLLYVMDSPWSGHARGMNRGQIYTRDGRLVASVAQEGLIRQVDRG